jgi:hypothetical protein
MKYLVCPGYIVSREDGHVRYIGYKDLIRLYGVDPDDCVLYTEIMQQAGFPNKEKQVCLLPREDGKYNLEERNGEMGVNAYEIQTSGNYSQKHIVISKDIADAERTYLAKYPNTTITSISLDAEYVLISEAE